MHVVTQVPTTASAVVLVHYIGIDVAKASLQIHWKPTTSPVLLPKGLPDEVANTPKGLARLIALLSHLQSHLGMPVQVICEATGGCHQALMQACWQAGILISQVNPRRVRDFARFTGTLAKTDKIDAMTIADYAGNTTPNPTAPTSKSQQRLTALVNYREQLVARDHAILCQIEHLREADLILREQRERRRIKAAIKDIEAKIAQTVASDSRLQAMSHAMSAVKGVGTLTAAKMLAYAPELGSLRRKQAAALAGLAPINHDSGNFRGQRHIGHGRTKIRQALYMAAIVGSRHNPILKAFYQRLIQRGKAPKVALTALMHKLLLHLNSISRPFASQALA